MFLHPPEIKHQLYTNGLIYPRNSTASYIPPQSTNPSLCLFPPSLQKFNHQLYTKPPINQSILVFVPPPTRNSTASYIPSPLSINPSLYLFLHPPEIKHQLYTNGPPNEFIHPCVCSPTRQKFYRQLYTKPPINQSILVFVSPLPPEIQPPAIYQAPYQPIHPCVCFPPPSRNSTASYIPSPQSTNPSLCLFPPSLQKFYRQLYTKPPINQSILVIVSPLPPEIQPPADGQAPQVLLHDPPGPEPEGPVHQERPREGGPQWHARGAQGQVERRPFCDLQKVKSAQSSRSANLRVVLLFYYASKIV